MLLNNRKYDVTEVKEGYKIDMKIRINNLTASDFGSYKCVAKNTLGEKEGFIRLYGRYISNIAFSKLFKGSAINKVKYFYCE